MTKVLILGSGFSVLKVHDYDYKNNGWKIVAVNNAWQATPTWDFHVHSSDFEGERPIQKKEDQTIVSDFYGHLRKFGGHHECGYSIVVCASYWALSALQPAIIGYLGCDLNYTRNEKGDTHFYGLGYGFRKRGYSDLDHFLKQYKDDKYNHSIELLYSRFQYYANQNKCLVFNLSNDPKAKIPFKQTTAFDLDNAPY